MSKSYIIYDLSTYEYIEPMAKTADNTTPEPLAAGTWPDEASALTWLESMTGIENRRYFVLPIWVKH